MSKEIPSLPTTPPDTLSAFLDDVRQRWSPEDQKRAVSLMINIFESIYNIRQGSSQIMREMHQRNAPAYFVELVSLSAPYYAYNPALLTADFLKLLDLRLDIHPKSEERFEPVDSGSPPMISLLDTLRKIQNDLATLPSPAPDASPIRQRNKIMALLQRLLGGE